MVKIEVIPNKKALLLQEKDKKIIVISDIHLDDNNDDVYDIIKELKELIKKHKPNILIIDGDIFNFGKGIDNVNILEKELHSLVQLEFTLGNHDLNIFPPFIFTDSVCFCHGDYEYDLKHKILIVGHSHPYYKKKKVFLHGFLKDNREFWVLPTFNDKVGGPEVSSKRDLIGFIFEKNLIKSCDIVNLKGKVIGKL